MWGEELKNEKSVFEVFTNYITGQANPSGHKVDFLCMSNVVGVNARFNQQRSL